MRERVDGEMNKRRREGEKGRRSKHIYDGTSG